MRDVSLLYKKPRSPSGLRDSIPLLGWRPYARGAPAGLVLLLVMLMMLEILLVVLGNLSLGTKVTFPPTESRDKVVVFPQNP